MSLHVRSYLGPRTLVACLALAGAGTGCAPALRAQPRETTAAAPSLQRFTSDQAGFDTHSYWLDTGREVVVFDAQFTDALARRLADQIHARTRSPIRWVVITHPNPDKFDGANVFRALGARVVASEATAAAIPGVHAYKRNYFVNVAHMFTEASYPQQAVVDVTFRGSYRLPLEAGEVVLRELAHGGVSSTQTVAWIPASRALVVGDLVHHRAHAWLEGGIVDGAPRPDLDGWIAALDELRAFDGATVYGGRGESAGVDAAVTEQQAYLRRAREEVTAYVAGLGERVGELSGEHADEHHRAITARMVAAFPDYALPYLIQYGVYGLADQIAAQRRR